jgi:hypothetical protein
VEDVAFTCVSELFYWVFQLRIPGSDPVCKADEANTLRGAFWVNERMRGVCYWRWAGAVIGRALLLELSMGRLRFRIRILACWIGTAVGIFLIHHSLR